MRPLKIRKEVWYERLEELSSFVYQHGRLPKTHDATSDTRKKRIPLAVASKLSRIGAGNLPENFVAALQDAHPLLLEAVAIAESNSQKLRSEKEQVKWLAWASCTGSNWSWGQVHHASICVFQFFIYYRSIWHSTVLDISAPTQVQTPDTRLTNSCPRWSSME